ncbi:hypothetical protein [Dinoroseobacter sp. S375]|uniref:hypothetical protein n=1 Tax=Dinoroseobacter sp. S375 TaxID=3415136 RepID=UPI003C7A8037
MNSVELQPIEIPTTSVCRYVSFNQALNLRAEGELTGDWHFKVMFFCVKDEPRKMASLAGEGMPVNSNHSLADRGIREMSKELQRGGVIFGDAPVFVANHYRAIADIVISELQAKRVPRRVTNRCINQWLDTKEQVGMLISNYLAHLPKQLAEQELELFNSWFSTIHFEN